MYRPIFIALLFSVTLCGPVWAGSLPADLQVQVNAGRLTVDEAAMLAAGRKRPLPTVLPVPSNVSAQPSAPTPPTPQAPQVSQSQRDLVKVLTEVKGRVTTAISYNDIVDLTARLKSAVEMARVEPGMIDPGVFGQLEQLVSTMTKAVNSYVFRIEYTDRYGRPHGKWVWNRTLLPQIAREANEALY